jgi:hypothetical protein
MYPKRLLCPERLRHVPRQFSWIDQRLVSQRHIGQLSPVGQGLYLFLVTVCDGQGLSYYGDKHLCQILALAPDALTRAREQLKNCGLIAYQKPLYQVLSLGHLDEGFSTGLEPGRVRLGSSGPQSLSTILGALGEKRS